VKGLNLKTCPVCLSQFQPKFFEQKMCGQVCRMKSLNALWKDRKIKCESCGKECSALSRNRKFCDDCHVKFCKICNKRFRGAAISQTYCSPECQRQDLWKSNSMREEGVGFECPSCLLRFQTKIQRAGHMASHRKEELSKLTNPTCRGCKVVLTEENWPPYYRKKPQRQYKCFECTRSERALYNKNSKDRRSLLLKRRREEQKKRAYQAYGGKCTCCGEPNWKFLTFDHVNNDGAAHRRKIGKNRLYEWLEKNGYPKDGFQLHCWSCNLGKYHNNGVCPHKETKGISKIS